MYILVQVWFEGSTYPQNRSIASCNKSPVKVQIHMPQVQKRDQRIDAVENYWLIITATNEDLFQKDLFTCFFFFFFFALTE
jgi:hypothetical protein